MRRGRARSIAANPVLVGAVTTLVVVTAVFLAYNANSGLPFVPTYELKVVAPSGARLVPGNDVREGGERIGLVSETELVKRPDGTSAAQLTLQLDESAAPLPEDSQVVIRPRSTLGLKYVDLVRGESARTLEAGSTIRVGDAAIPPELDQFFSIFDERTREDVRTNLETAGGFAGRGAALNETIEALPRLLGGLVPVMQTLSDPETKLRGFIGELADASRIVRPVAGDLQPGFAAGADVFEAISRDPQALRDTIAESPATLAAGISSFRAQRPLLRNLAELSDELQGTAREIRAAAPTLSSALAAGVRTLPTLPPFNERLGRSFDALRTLAAAPTTNLVLDGLTSTVATLNPTLKWVGPHITVCNYWNYWWTYLADHIGEQVPTGTVQRIQVKQVPLLQQNGLASFGAPRPADGSTESSDPVTSTLNGDPVALHAQPYGRAVDENGNADCESGQRGYPLRNTVVPNRNIVTNSRTPGNQGTTFTGRPRVPEGQTYSAEPNGIAPPVTRNGL